MRWSCLLISLLAPLTTLQAQQYPVVKVTEPGRAQWHLQLMATIKGPTGEGFNRIGVMLIDPKGGLLVTDRKDNAIYRFDGNGKYLGTIGRVGSGPMEFRIPYSLGWLGNDLLVYDAGNGRTLRWSRDGKFITQWMITGSRMTGDIPTIPGANGTTWLMQYGFGPAKAPARNFVRFPLTGKGDTVWLPPTPASKPTGKGDPLPEGVMVCYFGEPGRESLTDFASPYRSGANNTIPGWDGQLIGVTGFDYRLARTSGLTGDTIKVIERIIPRVPISDAEWKKVTDELAQFKKEQPAANCKGSFDREKFKPALRDLRADDNGNIWAEAFTTTGTRWDVWQGDKLLTSLVPPERSQYSPLAISADRFVITKEGDDGGTNVLVYKIVK